MEQCSSSSSSMANETGNTLVFCISVEGQSRHICDLRRKMVRDRDILQKKLEDIGEEMECECNNISSLIIKPTRCINFSNLFWNERVSFQNKKNLGN
jgi:hypothetical protein